MRAIVGAIALAVTASAAPACIAVRPHDALWDAPLAITVPISLRTNASCCARTRPTSAAGASRRASRYARRTLKVAPARGHGLLRRALAYPNAGHSVGDLLPDDPTYVPLGGTIAANQRARADGWPRLLAFLRPV